MHEIWWTWVLGTAAWSYTVSYVQLLTCVSRFWTSDNCWGMLRDSLPEEVVYKAWVANMLVALCLSLVEPWFRLPVNIATLLLFPTIIQLARLVPPKSKTRTRHCQYTITIRRDESLAGIWTCLGTRGGLLAYRPGNMWQHGGSVEAGIDILSLGYTCIESKRPSASHLLRWVLWWYTGL